MLMNAVYVFLDGVMYVISRKSVVLRVPGSACGHGGSHIYTCCWSLSHGDRNIMKRHIREEMATGHHDDTQVQQDEKSWQGSKG